METSLFNTYHESLYSHPLFRDLLLREKKALRKYYIISEYLKGESIQYDGDHAESLFIILEGAVLHQQEGKICHAYYPLDFWGLDTLFHSSSLFGTMTARDDSIVLRMKSSGFQGFLEEFPSVRQRLKPSYDSQKRLQSGFPSSVWMQMKKSGISKKKDKLLFEGRSSKKSFSIFMILPISLILVGLIKSEASPWWHSLTLAGMIFSICELFLRSMTRYQINDRTAFRRYFNWRSLRREHDELPLDQIKSVSVNVKGLLRQILKIGDLKIQTAGEGLVFSHIDNPKDVQKKVMDAIARKQKDIKGEEREEFRAVIRDRILDNPLPGYRGQFSQPAPGQIDGVRIFRKSVFILLFKTFLPLSFLILSFFTALFFKGFQSSILIFLIWSARFLTCGLIIWRTIDWWNDIYKIDLPFIWDIERKPFGSDEVRTQTDLAGVLNVKVSQKGLIKLLLNYGDVIIETPGNSGTLQFYNVWNPLKVQKEVFHYRDIQMKRKEKNVHEQNVQRFAEFADIFKQLTTGKRVESAG